MKPTLLGRKRRLGWAHHNVLGLQVAVDKEQILREIRRTAKANGGVPLGYRSFEAETGLARRGWQGRYWARWGDAVREAGLEANQPNPTTGRDAIAERVITMARRIGRIPVWHEMQLERRNDATFPGRRAFITAGMGTTDTLASTLASYCSNRDGYDDVLVLLSSTRRPSTSASLDTRRDGSVYLLKSGRYYKLGRAFDFGRRGRDINLQLPERAVTVHVIRTDDPVGIEAYWHKRFEDRRRNGEWFELTDADLRAFKRRKNFM